MGMNWNTGGSLWTSLCYSEGDWALDQLAQKHCGPSIFEGIQKLPGHGTGQVVPRDSAWAEGLDWKTADVPSSLIHSKILWNLLYKVLESILWRTQWRIIAIGDNLLIFFLYKVIYCYDNIW